MVAARRWAGWFWRGSDEGSDEGLQRNGSDEGASWRGVIEGGFMKGGGDRVGW